MGQVHGRICHGQKTNQLEAYWSLGRDREQRHVLVSEQMRERQPLQQKIIKLRQDQAQRLRELHRDLHRYGELRPPEPRDELSGQFSQATHPRTKTAHERLNDLHARKPNDLGDHWASLDHGIIKIISFS